MALAPLTGSLGATAKAELAVTALEPAIPTPGSGLSVNGRVGGTSIGSACAVTVRLSTRAVTSRSELRNLTTSSASAARRADASRVVAKTASDPQTGEWSVEMSARELGLTGRVPAGVYPLTVSADCGTSSAHVATVVPWLPRRAAVRPSSLILLWPVAVAPMRTLGNTWDDPSLAAQLQPFGRLRSLLDAGRDAPVSWLLDPETVDTVALAAGRADSSGAVRTGLNGQTRELAAAWLEDLAATAAGESMTALARAVPDAALLSANKSRAWAVSAQDTAVDDLNNVLGGDSPVTSVAAWPCPRTPRCLTRADMRALVSGGGSRPVATVLADSAAPVARDVYWSAGAVTTLPWAGAPRAVVTDSILDQTLATGDGITEPAMLQQRIIGDLALVTLERPKSPRILATTIALGLPTQESLTGAVAAARALSAASAAGFVTASQLSDVGDMPLDKTGRVVRFASRQRAKPSTTMASIKRAATDARRAAQLLSSLADREQWEREVAITSVNASSLMWRGAETAHRAYLTTFRTLAKDRRTGVHVVTPSRVYLGRSSGTIPFTVINTLNRPVTVYPRLIARPAARINLGEPPRVLRLEPGERAGVPVGARILGSGAVTVAFSVLSGKGEVISTPASTVVSTNAYARIAGYLVFAAFGLLVLLVINNIRRQVQRRRSGERGDGHEPAPGNVP